MGYFINLLKGVCMVDGINSTSTYVPNMSSYASSPDTYAGYTSNYSYPNDSVELSTQQQQQDKSNRNKLLVMAGGALALVGAVVIRKNLPVIGKYFEEGGGGATKAVEEGVSKVKGIFGKGENAEVKSFAEHNEAIKTAQENLDNVTKLQEAGKASKAEVDMADAALKAAKDAKAATENVHKGSIEEAIKAKNELVASRGEYKTAEEIKEYNAKLDKCNTNIKDAKQAYHEALTEGDAHTAKDAKKIVSGAVDGINANISAEKTSMDSINKAAKLYRNGDKAASIKAQSTRIDFLVKQFKETNGVNELTEEQFKSIKSQVISEMRTAFHEFDAAAKEATEKAAKNNP